MRLKGYEKIYIKICGKKKQRETEFSKSWIGRRKMKVKNAREKQSFLKWSRMR